MSVANFSTATRYSRADASHLQESIEELSTHLAGHVTGLTIESTPDGYRLRGACKTYFAKQVAQEALVQMVGGPVLSNDIQVAPWE
jgi:hypothetical protein